MRKYDVETPAPLVDRAKMERNIRRMVEIARGAGLRLRPHTKTHKCPAIAKIQLSLGARGVTVAKIGEAEAMAELRPGTFVFYDVSMVSLGAATFDDCAYTVLTTVVCRHSDRLVIDAGSKTLSTDRPAGQLYTTGLGVVVGHPHLRVARLSEDHGVLTIEGEGPLPRIGEKMEIIPNHVCQSVNLHDTLNVVADDEVIGTWRVEGRGKTI